MSRNLLFRLIGAVLLGVIAWQIGILFSAISDWPWVLLPALLGAALGFLFAPYLVRRPLGWMVRKSGEVAPNRLIAGMVGLFIGLVLSALLAIPLSSLPGGFGSVLPILTTVLLSYAGISIIVAREAELWQILSSYFPKGAKGAKLGRYNGRVIVDTSAIIDGRIADITQAGFINGPLLIPRFVLDELRHIADSSDPLRRNRGRRGIDMLSKLQKESDVPVQIAETEVEDVPEVDGKLIKLAKTLHCPIVTNDFNLDKIAELQGVKVLNINRLANAVRPVVLPGEEMSVRIIQEGKELGQGVAFLDDGTMVVVEGGRRYLHYQVDVVVTRVLQTAAGRMIFAHPKQE